MSKWVLTYVACNGVTREIARFERKADVTKFRRQFLEHNNHAGCVRNMGGTCHMGTHLLGRHHAERRKNVKIGRGAESWKDQRT